MAVVQPPVPAAPKRTSCRDGVSSFAWLGRNRRLRTDYEYRVQTTETMAGIAAIRLILNRLRPA
jgi:hypothetical protein